MYSNQQYGGQQQPFGMGMQGFPQQQMPYGQQYGMMPGMGMYPGQMGGMMGMQQQAKPDTSMRKIFVGGLPYHTDDVALREFFAKYGDIEEAVVIMDRSTGKSKGYGFVCVSSPSAALGLALGEQGGGSSSADATSQSEGLCSKICTLSFRTCAGDVRHGELCQRRVREPQPVH